MPTEKAKEIEDLLTSVTGLSRQKAAEEGICVWCKGKIGEFRDKLSIKEYTISGLCQDCQDKTFGL